MNKLFALLLLVASAPIFAGPTPVPVKPNAVQFTQGSITRTLAVPATAKSFTYSELLTSGQRRFSLGGQWVQFPNSGGPVSSIWKFPVAECPPLPADATQTIQCSVSNPGTTGTWIQTHGWVQTPPLQGCVVSPLPWTPTQAPAGACTPAATGLQPLIPQAQLLAYNKPVRGVAFTTQFGTSGTRITDHAVDRPGSELARNDYSRRMSYNVDKSRVFVYETGGAWLVYKTNPPSLEKQLNGPGGDAEMQWSPTDPDKLYYMDTNGGTSLYELTVSTNTHTVYYDMRAQAQAALGQLCDRLWTRSEGSPSADNRRWGFICQHYNQSTGDFDTIGYIVFDVVAHTVLWSQVSSTGVDHVSMTPSGRYLVPSGNTTYAVRVSDGSICTLRQSGEHSDTFVLPGGHDGYASMDYGPGELFYIDIDQCFANGGTPARVHIADIYENPLFGTLPGDCNSHCSFHVSGRAFDRPGFIVFSNYGVPKSPIFAYDVTSNALYGLGVTMDDDETYWDEVQAVISRDGHSLLYNDNFGTSTNVDAYRIDLQ